VELSDLAPSAASARELNTPPSADGVYSEQNSRAAAMELDRKGSAALAESLRGTGIDPVEVEARMKVGASNAALEHQWLAEDIRAIADSQGLDLSSDEQFERALREVDRVHDKIAADYGIDTAIAQRERAAEQTAVAAGRQADRDRATEQAEAQGRGSVPTAERRASKQDLANMHEPVGEEDERKFKAAVEERLTPEELAKLKRGDVSVLDGVGDRETQLTIAKNYLKAEGNSREAYRAVSDELINTRAAARQKARQERGVEHG
ncbi:MAG: hypothetical protein Q4G26_15905, partial [Paracoccus sp. (in: a-proteobacteria)]|nr:hypothetical protein [Paracoccus sp. (in: a-proteobacteria)]